MVGDGMIDVAIMGGGPAGATAATVLARAGRSVRLFEREVFPRFQIGESLLPAGNAVLREIGVWDQIEAAGFVRKQGAEFETANGRLRVHNIFAEGLKAAAPYTYQVERARFDTILLEHARASGAEIVQPAKVTAIEPTDEGYRLESSDGATTTCRFLIDASGRQAVLARALKIPRKTLSEPSRVAVYGHYEGVARRSGPEGGNIVVTRWRDGWFWSIPIDATRTSVGFVSPAAHLRTLGGDAEHLLAAAIAATPAMTTRMETARALGPLRVTSDYSFSHAAFAGDRFVLAGDAACFLDPVFSSGVYFAMVSGRDAALLVERALARNQPVLALRAQQRYTRDIHRRVEVMRGLVDAFYDRSGVEVFMRPTTKWRLFAAVNSVVGGQTRMPWAVRWRYALFRLVVRQHQRHRRLVQRIPEGWLGAPLELPNTVADSVSVGNRPDA